MRAWLLGGGLALYGLTAFFNLGLIATDDYDFLLSRAIPAQNWTYGEIVDATGVRSPFPALVVHSLARLALWLGVDSPDGQLQLAQVVLGLLSFSILAWAVPAHFPRESRARLVALALVGFYFLCPLLYTRPLVESLSAAPLAAASLFACRYHAEKRLRWLVAALAWLVLGSLFRYQLGMVYPVLLWLALRPGSRGHLPAFLAASAAGAFFSGLVDWVGRGSWHYSLFAYVGYQMRDFGKIDQQPFYVFPLLFAGLSVPPAFFSRFRGLRWRESYRPLLPTVLLFAVFVGIHSLGGHKEERFMIPVIPLFLVLLTPLLHHLIEAGARKRLAWFVGVNAVLLPLASFHPPQTNIVQLMRYLQRQPEIRVVNSVDESLLIFPSAFVARPLGHRRLTREEAARLKALPCDETLALREDIGREMGDLKARFRFLAVFRPGPLERLVIRLNPLRNRRRSAVALYADPRCGKNEPIPPR